MGFRFRLAVAGLDPLGSIRTLAAALGIDRQGRIRTRGSGYAQERAELARKEALAEPG